MGLFSSKFRHQRWRRLWASCSRLFVRDVFLLLSHLVYLGAFLRRRSIMPKNRIMPKNSLFLSISYNGNLEICTVNIYIDIYRYSSILTQRPQKSQKIWCQWMLDLAFNTSERNCLHLCFEIVLEILLCLRNYFLVDTFHLKSVYPSGQSPCYFTLETLLSHKDGNKSFCLLSMA